MIDWLLTTKSGLFTGTAVIWVVLIVALVWAVWKFGDVRPAPAPVFPKPLTDATTIIIPALPVEPNYLPSQESWYPLAGELAAAIDDMTAAAIDLTETVELRPVDPLDDTHELEQVDPSVPLFYSLKRPRPYVAESFTEGISRARIARALEAGKPQ